MNYIKILNDLDFGGEINPLNNPKKRISARGIVINSEGKIAILNKKNKNEYKLVGGGTENNEDPSIAFKRKVLEEAGCEVEIDKFIGVLKEERTKNNFIQESYVYISHVTRDLNKLNLTQKELDEGGCLLWLNVDEALNYISECEQNIKPSKYSDLYNSKFIVRRDYIILKYYIDNYLNNS